MKICNKECRTLMIQETRTSSPQSFEFMMTLSAGVADGCKVVIGHHSQEKVIQPCKQCEKIHLCDAFFIGNIFSLGVDALEHLWDGGRDKTDIYKGQDG